MMLRTRIPQANGTVPAVHATKKGGAAVVAMRNAKRARRTRFGGDEKRDQPCAEIYATNWQGRVVVITGAAGGLGRVLTQRYRQLGATVVMVDVSEKGMREVMKQTGGSSPRAIAISADLSRVSESRRVISAVEAAFARVDILINNAGLLIMTPIEQTTEVAFDTLMSVNLKAPFFLSQGAVGVMKRKQRGRIINVSSIGARTGGVEGASVYAATKAGLIALTKAFARAYASDGILVNAVAPGMMRTPMITDLEQSQRESQIPLRRAANPAEVAEAIIWLSSDLASYVTGATLDVNGGALMV